MNNSDINLSNLQNDASTRKTTQTGENAAPTTAKESKATCSREMQAKIPKHARRGNIKKTENNKQHTWPL